MSPNEKVRRVLLASTSYNFQESYLRAAVLLEALVPVAPELVVSLEDSEVVAVDTDPAWVASAEVVGQLVVVLG